MHNSTGSQSPKNAVFLFRVMRAATASFLDPRAGGRLALVLLAVILLAVIRGVETGTLEDYPCPSSYKPGQLLLLAAGASGQGLIGHGLKSLKYVAAVIAFVFVGRHNSPFLFKRLFQLIRKALFGIRVFSGGPGKLLNKPALFSIEIGRYNDIDLYQLVTLAAAMNIRDAFFL